MNTQGKTLVFFDDVCVLCNRFVKCLIHLDKADQLRFVALNSKYAKSNGWLFDTDAVVVLDIDGQSYYAELAILKICQNIAALKWFSLLFRIMPKGLQKFFYRLIAKNRYRLFGKYKSCPLNHEKNESIRNKIII